MPRKEAYRANPEHYRSKAKEYRIKYPERLAITRYKRALQIREYLQLVKEQTPCADCGKQYPYYVMEFDHINSDRTRRGKNGNGCIGSLTSQRWNVVLQELAKCEVVCANCHRVRTWKKLYADGTWGDMVSSIKGNRRYRLEPCSCYGTDEQRACAVCGGLGVIAYIKTTDGEVVGSAEQHRNQLKTKCSHGHLYTPDNIIMDRGYRSCRKCKAERDRATYHRKMGQRKAVDGADRE